MNNLQKHKSTAKVLICPILSALTLILTGCAQKNEPDSVGIIGGADNPTIMYMLSRIFQQYFGVFSVAVLVCLLTVGIILLIVKKHNKRK